MPRAVVPHEPCIGAIQAAVCDLFGVTLREMVSPRRAARLVRARHAAAWLARQAGHSLPAIGRAFGDRDHTTIMHAVGRAERLLASDRQFAAAVGGAAQRAGVPERPCRERGSVP